jgi:PAS domain S-box-containing protein
MRNRYTIVQAPIGWLVAVDRAGHTAAARVGDGSVRWVHSRGFPITDDNGTVYRMSGIAEDITRPKT